MKIKRFFAKDMKSALQEVKETLGVDAVIMSNKKVVGGIEIVAAVDGEGTQLPTSTPMQYHNNINELRDDRVQLSGLGRRNPLDNRSDIHSYSSLSTEHNHHQDHDAISGFSQLFNRAQQKNGYNNGYNNNNSYNNSSNRDLNNSANNRENNPNSLSALLKRQQSSLFSEQDKERLLEKSTPSKSYQSQSAQPPVLDNTRYDKNSTSNTQQELTAMREEISSIRQLLQHQVSGLMWQEVERQEPLRAMLIKRLEKMGLSPELADQLAGYIPDNALPHQVWKSVLSLLSDQLIIARHDLLSMGGILALLGPTGVGKTTTVAKLAAKAAMEYGADDIALITTDSYRIAAHEQLATYGRILGCPVKVASTADELNQALYQFRHRRLVLLDTAGMGQRDVRLSEQLDNLIKNSGAKITSLLVLAATSQRRVLQETVDHFKQIPLAGCVLTKLDESLSLGELISVTIENALPIAYFSDGQRVPEDLQVADRKFLINRASELLEHDLKQDSQFWLSRSPDAKFER